jgi:hypothetical protein
MATYITGRVIDDGSIGLNELQLNGSSFANRNKIINGAMEIDQRNDSVAVSLNNSGQYCIDRFFVASAGTATVQRVSDAPPGFITSLRYTVGTPKVLVPGDGAYIFQAIEGQNLIDLQYNTQQARPVTISFWVKCSLTGTFSGFWRTLLNNDYRSYVFTYTINQANTWEYKTITVPGDTQGTFNSDNRQGAGVLFDMGSGTLRNTSTPFQWVAGDFYRTADAVRLNQTAGATFQVTGLQVELGTVATPFERRQIGIELALCQRYFQLFDAHAIAAYPTLAGAGVTTTVNFPVTMRKTPDITPGTITYNTNGGNPLYFFNDVSPKGLILFVSQAGQTAAGTYGVKILNSSALAEL